jgi:hypothetical protein
VAPTMSNAAVRTPRPVGTTSRRNEPATARGGVGSVRSARLTRGAWLGLLAADACPAVAMGSAVASGSREVVRTADTTTAGSPFRDATSILPIGGRRPPADPLSPVRPSRRRPTTNLVAVVDRACS